MLKKPLQTQLYLQAFGLPNLICLDVRLEIESSQPKWDPTWGDKGKLKCYTTEVIVTGIVKGTHFIGRADMGGSWGASSKALTNDDINGYLPQLASDAVNDAITAIQDHFGQDVSYRNHAAMLELYRFSGLLENLMKENYAYGDQQTLLEIPENKLLQAARLRLIGRVFNLHPTGKGFINYSGGRILRLERKNSEGVDAPFEIVYDKFGPIPMDEPNEMYEFMRPTQFREFLALGTTQVSNTESATLLPA